MGVYDLPAAIDYILQENSTSKLYYIGYSQGTSSLMVLLAERPEYNDKIHVADLMAPIGYLDHADVLVKFATAKIMPILEVISKLKKIEVQVIFVLKKPF